MLELELKNQLSALFEDLPAAVELRVHPSDHQKQVELVDLLTSLTELTPKISMNIAGTKTPLPTFSILRDGKPTGINFGGIPGGHEFSSLILAILNSSGKGKLPDAATQNRIRRLATGLKVTTYVSLSCENCPDVVQALNQIALTHGQLEHTMIDGDLIGDTLEARGVRAVPAIFVGDQLIHTGRAGLGDLLLKLESAYGGTEERQTTDDLGRFDVIVVGGGPAGAAAAIYSVRKGLKTALISDKIGGQVLETKGIENFIGTRYIEGAGLSAHLNHHLADYPITLLEHRKVISIIDGKEKAIHLDSRESLSGETVIIATGARWRELGVPGEKEYLGRGVAFCPHCEGPFYKNKKVAVVGGGNSGVEAAIDLAGICREVVLVEFLDKLKADEVLVRKLQSLANVKTILNAKTTAIVGDGHKVTGMQYQERFTDVLQNVALDGVFVQIGLLPNSAPVKDLLELNSYGEIVIDDRCRSSRPGFYAAGDVTTVPFKQIVIAVGEGAKAALAAFEDRMRASS